MTLQPLQDAGKIRNWANGMAYRAKVNESSLSSEFYYGIVFMYDGVKIYIEITGETDKIAFEKSKNFIENGFVM